MFKTEQRGQTELSFGLEHLGAMGSEYGREEETEGGFCGSERHVYTQRGEHMRSS